MFIWAKSILTINNARVFPVVLYRSGHAGDTQNTAQETIQWDNSRTACYKLTATGETQVQPDCNIWCNLFFVEWHLGKSQPRGSLIGKTSDSGADSGEARRLCDHTNGLCAINHNKVTAGRNTPRKTEVERAPELTRRFWECLLPVPRFEQLFFGQFPPSLDNSRSPHVYINQRLQIVWSSWWWAVCCSKHVEPSINFGIINSITMLHLVGYFYSFILRTFCGPG